METVSNFADVEGGDCAARRTGKMKSANLIRYSRTFTRLEEWEREVEMARIYAGFHYHHSSWKARGSAEAFRTR
jgi:hypothetical protein